jgi:hypothetical protein
MPLTDTAHKAYVRRAEGFSVAASRRAGDDRRVHLVSVADVVTGVQAGVERQRRP